MHIFSVESRTCMVEKEGVPEGKLGLENLSEQMQEIINQTQGLIAVHAEHYKAYQVC